MAKGLWDTCKTLNRSGDGYVARAKDADGSTILGRFDVSDAALRSRL
jgi:hypothetical protein